MREMFTDVPNPAIYGIDLFLWSRLKCEVTHKLRERHLFCYFGLSSNF